MEAQRPSRGLQGAEARHGTKPMKDEIPANGLLRDAYRTPNGPNGPEKAPPKAGPRPHTAKAQWHAASGYPRSTAPAKR